MIKINFDFKDRRDEDLVQLNDILATMKLDELSLENEKDYLATTMDREGNLISNRYGLDSGTLICKLSKSKSGYQYRIDSEVIDKSVDEDVFLQNWSNTHPDRTVRIFIRDHFDDMVGCLIVHHQRD